MHNVKPGNIYADVNFLVFVVSIDKCFPGKEEFYEINDAVRVCALRVLSKHTGEVWSHGNLVWYTLRQPPLDPTSWWVRMLKVDCDAQA